MSLYSLILTVLGLRSLLAILAMAGGIYAVYKGTDLIKKGVGVQKSDSQIAFKFGTYGLRISTNTIGTYLIATSVIWILCAWLFAPAMGVPTITEKSKERVACSFPGALSLEGGSVEGRSVLEKPAELKRRFLKAANRTIASDAAGASPARPEVVSVEPDGDGTYSIRARIGMNHHTLDTRFDPRVERGNLLFDLMELIAVPRRGDSLSNSRR